MSVIAFTPPKDSEMLSAHQQVLAFLDAVIGTQDMPGEVFANARSFGRLLGAASATGSRFMSRFPPSP
jgi:hypothetical protein